MFALLQKNYFLYSMLMIKLIICIYFLPVIYFMVMAANEDYYVSTDFIIYN